MYVDGNIKQAVLNEKNDEIEEQLANAKTDLDRVNVEIAAMLKTPEHRTGIKARLEELRAGLGQYVQSRFETLSFADKRSLIEVVFDYAGDKVQLSYQPGDTNRYCSQLPAGVRPTWKSILNFDVMERAVKEARLGKTLGEALTIAQRSVIGPGGQDICKLQGWSRPSYLQ